MIENNLQSFVLTTGSKGLHVVVPIKPHCLFDEARVYLQDLLQRIIQQYPKEFTTEIAKSKRAAPVYLDTLRNSYGQTAVTPYAVRAKAGAPVATPLAWEELEDASLTAGKYHIKNIAQRLTSRLDPWAGYQQAAKQRLPVKM